MSKFISLSNIASFNNSNSSFSLDEVGKSTGFAGLGRKVYLAYNDDKKEWGLISLNVIERIVRCIFGFYEETHSKTIEGALKDTTKLGLLSPLPHQLSKRITAIWNISFPAANSAGAAGKQSVVPETNQISSGQLEKAKERQITEIRKEISENAEEIPSGSEVVKLYRPIHRKRDTQQINLQSRFPDLTDLKTGYSKTQQGFDLLAVISKEIIESNISATHERNPVDLHANNSKTSDPGLFLTTEVMAPLFEECSRIVQERLDKNRAFFKEVTGFDVSPYSEAPSTGRGAEEMLTWYYIEQQEAIAYLDKLNYQEIITGLPQVLEIEEKVKMDDGYDPDNPFSFTQLAETYIRYLTYAQLSDPQCHLGPKPGERIKFKRDDCQECMSPGSIKHGAIKEGDEVEVVFPALSVIDSESNKQTFLNPLYVRRLN